MEAHDRSDDDQTPAVVTKLTASAGDGALRGQGPSLTEPSDVEVTDAVLIERSRQEPDCFAKIFDRHANEILRYAHTRLGPDLAEDVAAEVWLEVARRIGSPLSSSGRSWPPCWTSWPPGTVSCCSWWPGPG